MILGLSPAPLQPPFSPGEAERAYDAWGCNCGPAALAAICGLTLDEAHVLLPGFDEKRYTNPKMMLEGLRRTGREWKQLGGGEGTSPCLLWPDWGLARIQWEGPWTLPGVPMRARYRYTHWVGAHRRPIDGGVEVGIFDVNQLVNGSGWAALINWREVTAPWLAGHYPRATGGWHITHAIEVQR
jgi:hypothetical protein